MHESFRKQLEKCYGSIDQDVIKKFGASFFNGIKGWQFPIEEVRKFNKAGKLLTMDLDFPGQRCRLNCTYCFAKSGKNTGTYYRQDKGDSPLTIEKIKSKIKEAKSMGLQSIKIIGYREPFDNPGFYEFIDFVSKKNIHLVIFTSGYTLGENHFAGGLKEAIDFLANKKVSLMFKLHTLDRDEEDKIVNYPGYSKIRDKYLRAFLEDGRFTNQSPTRLGIENVISSSNTEELKSLYEYFKLYKNVFVDLDPPIPVGRTGTLQEAEKAGLMPQPKLKKLCLDIYRINQKYKINFCGISPYFGGDPCTQLPNGLYITLSGKVVTCCGGDEVIGDVKKESLQKIFNNNPYRDSNSIYHNCPYRLKRGMMTEDFIQEVEEKLKK